ncbi:MAG TPA: CsgG/HfaB family protein [Gemmatimonadales bacterium]
MTGASGDVRGWPLARPAAALACLALSGCAGHRAVQVSPAEIPALEAQLQASPADAELRVRYAAALFSADRCDAAVTEARRAQGQVPRDAVPVLVIGQCLEKQQQFDQALAAYRGFVVAHPDARGVSAVRAREMLAFRQQANVQARLALQNEAQLAQQSADPNTIAVLPLQVSGDSSYQALSRGLAQILTSDLALIQRFRLVERLHLSSLMDELSLGQGQRVDPSTAARVGRLVQAGRLVNGLVAIPPQGNVRLEANVVMPTGEVAAPEAVTGRFRDLLRIEKDLVVALSARLGYSLSEAERRRILENGTQNLTAFLAYSRGLVAEDLGDFSRAAAFFSQAVQADPGFQQARESFQASASADAVQGASAGDVTTVAAEEPAPEPAASDPVSSAVNTSVNDIAANQSEQNAPGGQTQTTQQATSTTTAVPPPTTVNKNPPPLAQGTIRIVFRLP